ncbi:hypothetical protein ACC732_27935 [Rhizobium ruizarguesonis]
MTIPSPPHSTKRPGTNRRAAKRYVETQPYDRQGILHNEYLNNETHKSRRQPDTDSAPLDWMSAIYTEQGLHMTDLSAQFTTAPSPRKDNADSIVLRTIARVMT